jgi:hypothetical protein
VCFGGHSSDECTNRTTKFWRERSFIECSEIFHERAGEQTGDQFVNETRRVRDAQLSPRKFDARDIASAPHDGSAFHNAGAFNDEFARHGDGTFDGREEDRDVADADSTKADGSDAGSHRGNPDGAGKIGRV